MEQETNHTEQHTTHKKLTNIISVPAAIITGAVIIGIAVLIALHPIDTKKSDTVANAPADTTPTSVPAAVAMIRTDDHIRGSASADVVVFEYSDSDCTYCQRFHPTMEKIVEDYKGKVAWVYRFFPLDIHPNAHTEALALQCVGELSNNANFASYLDTLIDVTLKNDPKSNEVLTLYATQLGVDKSLFTACMANQKTADRIQRDSLEATSIGAQGTPFSIAVNMKTGKQAVIAGAYPIEDVKKMIDDLLK